MVTPVTIDWVGTVNMGSIDFYQQGKHLGIPGYNFAYLLTAEENKVD